MYSGLSVVFLLLGLTLIITVVLLFINPYDSIAFANVEKMRAAMDQACLNPAQAVDISFTLEQNNPARVSSVLTFIPIYITNIFGDPKYVVYYEAFPPGEGTGWEIYHLMQNRLLSPLPGGFEGKNSEDVAAYVNDIKNSWTAYRNHADKLEGIIVNNIIIGPRRSDYYLGEESGLPVPDAGPSEARKELEKYGVWKNVDDATGAPSGGDNQFAFTNYRALNSFGKTAAKYLPCGENSLCFKTPSGVYSYPLRYCNGIKAAQIIYDASAAPQDVKLKRIGFDSVEVFGGTGIMTFLLKRAHPVLAALSIPVIINGARDALVFLVDIKTGDFAVVSPCTLKDVRIEKNDCNNFEYPGSSYFSPSFTPCTKVITYPLYQYDPGGSLTKVGEHSACVEKIGNTIYDTSGLGGYAPDDQCLQVFVTNAEDYCWSKDPYKDNVLPRLNLAELVRIINDYIGTNPIRENTAFINDPATGQSVVLLPTDIALKKGKEFYDALDRKWWWGWPG